MKNLRIVLLIYFLAYSVSCSYNNMNKTKIEKKKSKNDKIIFVETIHSSSTFKNKKIYSVNNIIDNNLQTSWRTNLGAAPNERIFISFSDSVYVSFIKLNSVKYKYSAQIKSIVIYINNKKLNTYSLDDYININNKIKSISIRIVATSNIKFLEGYDKNKDYKIAFFDSNYSVGLHSLKIWNKNYEEYILKNKSLVNETYDKYKIQPINKKHVKLLEIIDRQYINNSEKSIIIRSNNTFETYRYDSNKTNSESVLHSKGKWNLIPNKSKTKLKLSGVIINENNKKHFEDIIEISKTKIIGGKYINTYDIDLPDNSFVELIKLDTNFVLDIKYATTNNFTGKILYECPKCMLRYKAAKDLIRANKKFMQIGYRIKLFDCYRPYSVQKKMFEVYPVIGYVASPKTGSVHNRGAAVDLTLVDSLKRQVDMGTEFDFFGRKANHTYTNLPETVLNKRILLKKTLEEFNFSHIRSEWWHYNHKTARKFPISDFKFNCE